MSQESGHELAGSSGSGSLSRLQIKYQLGLLSHLKAGLGKDVFQSSLVWYWQDPVPHRYWTEDFRSLLADGQRLPQLLATWVSPSLKSQGR